MVFVGVLNPPSGTWPNQSYTVINNTPLIREKPYLSLDTNGNYIVMVPTLKTNSSGTTWSTGPTPGIFHSDQPVLSGAARHGQRRQHQRRAERRA